MECLMRLFPVLPGASVLLVLLRAERSSHLVAKTLLVRLFGDFVSPATHNPSIVHHQVLLLESTRCVLSGSVPDLSATADSEVFFHCF